MLLPEHIRFTIAPMLDWTDRHCRVFHRTMTRHARLYTEMVTTGAIIYGPRDRLLAFNAEEHPVAVQLGGSDAAHLAESARICTDYGYDEINLNVGCPSDRVQNGAFGACLMQTPEIVAQGVAAMKAVTNLPVTVKCRIGVDEQDPEVALFAMAKACADVGVDALVVHARKAWLQGLSPKENRDIPPLDYPLVYRLKQLYPHLPIAINGGIATFAEMHEHLTHVDGVMIGRAAYQEPALLLKVDEEIFGQKPPVADAFETIEAYIPYIERQLGQGARLHNITRHMLGLFNGLPGSRAYRRHLSTFGMKADAGVDVLRDAVAHVSREPITITKEDAA